MKDLKDIVFIIQARKGSTRVPNKMLRPFADSNLFEIVIQKLLKSKVIPKEQIYLSIYDEEFYAIAKKYDLNVYRRSERSVQEPLELHEALEWYDKLPFKYWVKINGCNPLLKIDTIDDFVQTFINSENNGLFGVIEKRTFLFNSNGTMMNGFNGDDKYKATLETKFVETTYEAGHCMYAGSMEDISKGLYMGSFTKKNDPELYPFSEKEFYDIDWIPQFEMAEMIYKKYKEDGEI